jgi:hypothetical protein
MLLLFFNAVLLIDIDQSVVPHSCQHELPFVTADHVHEARFPAICRVARWRRSIDASPRDEPTRPGISDILAGSVAELRHFLADVRSYRLGLGRMREQASLPAPMSSASIHRTRIVVREGSRRPTRSWHSIGHVGGVSEWPDFMFDVSSPNRGRPSALAEHARVRTEQEGTQW